MTIRLPCHKNKLSSGPADRHVRHAPHSRRGLFVTPYEDPAIGVPRGLLHPAPRERHGVERLVVRAIPSCPHNTVSGSPIVALLVPLSPVCIGEVRAERPAVPLQVTNVVFA